MLTIGYLTMGSEDPVWLDLFLSDFKDCKYKPIEFKGYEGNLQKGRMDIIKSVKTPFFCFVDPDDRVNCEVLLECLQFLIENEEYAACFSRDRYINCAGIINSTQNSLPFSHEKLKMSPLEMHNSTIYRTDKVLPLLPFFEKHTFNKFEWALKLILSKRYPIKKINKIGYSFRINPLGHHKRKYEPEDQINYSETIPFLEKQGLI